MKRHIFTLLLTLSCALATTFSFCPKANAQNPVKATDVATLTTNAQKAYEAKDYAQAAQLYQSILQKAETSAEEEQTAENSYNLGNCFYRMKEFSRAVLYYQRALKLQPDNEDAAFNLQLTQAKLADHFESPSEMFFVTWFRNVVTNRSADTWGHTAMLTLIVALLLFVCFRFASHTALRKAGFFGFIAFFALTIVFYVFAALQQQRKNEEQLFVVMSETQSYTSPSPSAPKSRVLNEGTTLKLTDTANERWIQVEMPDGKTTWIDKSTVEKV